jgi:pimeloyl-ACP methyl ester carboxylesterase
MRNNEERILSPTNVEDHNVATLTPPIRKRHWVRWLKRLVLGGFALVVLAVLSGTIYEWIASRADARRFPQEGRLVDIGGFRLNIDCSGTAAAAQPAVILESGGGVPAFGWHLVQPQIARFARVCSYDRAGYGWSDAPLSPVRTSLQIATELHTLLHNAGVAPPYILVGHSLGGFNIRVFNAQYPDEVAGAVFVDSSHEDQLKRMTPGLKKMSDKSLKSFQWRVRLLRLAIHCGTMRAVQSMQAREETLAPEFMEELNYLQRKDAYISAVTGELNAFDESVNEVRNSGSFGDKPVIVLTAGKFPPTPGISKEESDAFLQLWIHELQPKLARLSTQGKQEVVSGSDHMIPFRAPQAVVDAVQQVFQKVQNLPDSYSGVAMKAKPEEESQ